MPNRPAGSGFVNEGSVGKPGGVATLDAAGRQSVAEVPSFVGIPIGRFRLPGMTDDQVMQAALDSVRGPASPLGTRTLFWSEPEMVTAGAFSLDNLNDVTINFSQASIRAKPGAGRVTAMQMYGLRASGAKGSKNVRFTNARVTKEGSGLKTDVGIVGPDGKQRKARETWSDTKTPAKGEAEPWRDYRGNPDRIITFLRVISTGWDDGIAAGRARYENISVDHCDLFGTEHLPIWFQGAYGDCSATYNRFERCLDPGWIWTERSEAHHNLSFWSADNGLSLSRGNGWVHASYNDIHDPWFMGIMAGTFTEGGVADPGPDHVSIHHNRIWNSGELGIRCDGGSQGFDISFNQFFGAQRGSLSNSNFYGVCIYVSGMSAARKARNGQIVGNYMEGAERGGVQVADYVDGFYVAQNIVVRPGSRRLTDGVTVPSDSHNFGVAVRAASAATVTNGVFESNRTFDDRLMDDGTTPVAYYATFVDASVASIESRNNPAVGTRSGSVSTAAGAVADAPVTTRRLTVGSGTATDSRVVLSGASGSSRMLAFTVGADELLRYLIRTVGTGTLAVDLYNDAATSYIRALQFDRNTGKATFSNDVAVGAALSALSAAITGALSAASATFAGNVRLGSATTGEVRLQLESVDSNSAKIIEFIVAGATRGTIRQDTQMKFHLYTSGGTAQLVMAFDAVRYAATFTNPPTIPSYTTAQLTKTFAGTHGRGAQAYNSTTSKPVWSDGTEWRYADGSTVIAA